MHLKKKYAKVVLVLLIVYIVQPRGTINLKGKLFVFSHKNRSRNGDNWLRNSIIANVQVHFFMEWGGGYIA